MTRETPDMVNEEAIAWFVRTHSDQRTLSDEDRFAQWLKQDSRHAEAYARVEKAWRVAGPDIAARPLVSERRAGANKRFWTGWLRTGLAAAIVVVATSAYLAHELGRPPAGTFATPPGEQRTLKLADGSVVILNTRSEVTIELTEHQRLIHFIRGEARFEVAKDATRPFIVDAGSAQVHALGTAFDVRVSEQRVAVTLVEGQVEITPSSALATVPALTRLTPGQQFSLDVTHGEQRVETVNLARASAWIGRQLIFDATPLAVAVQEANRYLPAPIVIDDPSVQDIRVSGVVRAGNVESFVTTLESSFPVRAVRHTDGSLTLARRADDGSR
jgi:transmembrane sensor